MKNKIELITGILLIYGGILSLTQIDANFANVGLIVGGFLIIIYVLLKSGVVSNLISFKSKN